MSSSIYPVPLSGIQETTVDAKGDIIAATAADAVARLAVGANDTILTADSSTATGLKWAAPAGGLTFQNVADTSERTTTSTSFVSLGSSSAVTITTGTKALVLFGGQFRYYSGAITFDVSGATTSTGDDSRACFQTTGEIEQVSRHFVITGLTAGSNTFTLKYRSVSGNNIQFARTNLTVIDLGS